MAIDTFLLIDGVKGESTDSKHKDWIEVSSYSAAAVPPASATAAEKPGVSQHGDLVLSKHVDSASPKLQQLCSSGKHISKATIEVMRASGDKPVKYLVIEMTDVVISSVSPQIKPKIERPSGKAGADLPTESISLNYGTIKWTYTQQKRADGAAAGKMVGDLKLR